MWLIFWFQNAYLCLTDKSWFYWDISYLSEANLGGFGSSVFGFCDGNVCVWTYTSIPRCVSGYPPSRRPVCSLMHAVLFSDHIPLIRNGKAGGQASAAAIRRPLLAELACRWLVDGCANEIEVLSLHLGPHRSIDVLCPVCRDGINSSVNFWHLHRQRDRMGNKQTYKQRTFERNVIKRAVLHGCHITNFVCH
jgi:hypothetical protein